MYVGFGEEKNEEITVNAGLLLRRKHKTQSILFSFTLLILCVKKLCKKL